MERITPHWKKGALAPITALRDLFTEETREQSMPLTVLIDPGLFNCSLFPAEEITNSLQARFAFSATPEGCTCFGEGKVWLCGLYGDEPGTCIGGAAVQCSAYHGDCSCEGQTLCEQRCAMACADLCPPHA